MKRNALILVTILVAASVSPAPGQSADPIADNAAVSPSRPNAVDICRCERNYVACTKSANDGVVESAIAQSVRMQWALPSNRFEDLRSRLASLAASGRTASIRYKAYLAELVFDSPSMFSREREGSYTWDEDLFAALSNRAEKALLGCNSGSPR